MRILSLLTLLMLVGCDDSIDTSESPIAAAWLAQDEGSPHDGKWAIQRHTVSFRRDSVYIETYDLAATDPNATDVVVQDIGTWRHGTPTVTVSVDGQTRDRQWSLDGDALTLDGASYVRLDESGVF